MEEEREEASKKLEESSVREGELKSRLAQVESELESLRREMSKLREEGQRSLAEKEAEAREMGMKVDSLEGALAAARMESAATAEALEDMEEKLR